MKLGACRRIGSYPSSVADEDASAEHARFGFAVRGWVALWAIALVVGAVFGVMVGSSSLATSDAGLTGFFIQGIVMTIAGCSRPLSHLMGFGADPRSPDRQTKPPAFARWAARLMAVVGPLVVLWALSYRAAG
jgi:hypothetical protein